MTFLKAILLGIIQGLTEFLPVSSSGHLELAKALFGDNSLPQESMLMTVVLHGATALSTIIVFRKEIADIFRGLFQFKWNNEAKFSLLIVISMIPATAIGLFFENEIEMFFGGQYLLVGFMLVITGILLFLADRSKNTNKHVGYLSALIVGVAQAFAIIPGISRSGATIATSVLLKIDRKRAARFSFLMVVPLILGKMIKDIGDGAFLETTVNMGHLGAGFIAALLTGIFACHWMIKLVQKSKLSWFGIYCLVVGTSAILYYI